MNGNVFRRGTIAEYKAGHYYVTKTEWDDGHTEIEVHRCEPTLLFHSCDPKEWEPAMERVQVMAESERQSVKLALTTEKK